MYNAASKKAEEFIDHEEILASIEYAQENKHNRPYIESLIERAADCKGLSHREAMVLLECEEPDLVERMEAEGHQIGIHTYDHVSALTGLSAADFDAQVGRTRRLLTAILGRSDFPLRPPYGAVDPAVRANAGGPIYLWSVDPEDWATEDAAAVAEHLVSHARDGDILLLHDIFPSSVEAALRAVDALHARGFYFVTVEELLAARQITPETGVSFRCAYP